MRLQDVLASTALQSCLPAIDAVVADALNAGELIILGSRSLQNGRGRAIMCGIAALMSSDAVNRMAIHGRGLVSIAVDAETAFRLGLRHMAGVGRGPDHRAQYLVSVEASSCRGTGISAAERAETLRAAGAPAATQDDLISPGHVMPYLVAATLSRGSALPDIAHAIVTRRTAYTVPAWCDVLNESGDLASLDESVKLAGALGLPVIIAEDAQAGPAASRQHRLPKPEGAMENLRVPDHHHNPGGR